MHNTEYEKYPTSGEENVEVDVFWPIQEREILCMMLKKY